SMIATLIMHNMVTYRPKINEYMLVYGHVEEGGATWPLLNRLQQRYGDLIERLGPRHLMIPRRGPRIIVCTDGRIRCAAAGQSCVLDQGQALFIPSEDGRVDITMPQDFDEAGGSFLLASTPV
ncbi:MAG: mannose-6-phosphate isomerase, partial [Bifidobacterium sp.]|nr:mannose-6-phosphate isomerase [Bifidobacterium sp.]